MPYFYNCAVTKLNIQYFFFMFFTEFYDFFKIFCFRIKYDLQHNKNKIEIIFGRLKITTR